ncbi:MAG: ATP-binding protein [Spirochaetales bacterium]|nr:ATP-binding protein [Spirochaetales bacterium]
MLKRFAYSKILRWKSSDSYNLLLVGGPSGVGKSTLCFDFVQNEYNSYLILDSRDEDILKIDFSTNPECILIDNLDGSINKLQEIQDLCLKNKNIDFIVIDSFAKAIKGNIKLEKVNYLSLSALTYEEFLINANFDLYEVFTNLSTPNLIDIELHEKLISYYRLYLIVGGMPEVVFDFIDKGYNFQRIRAMQNKIISEMFLNLKFYFKLTDYKNFDKIIKLIFPTLLRPNKKFKITDISNSRRLSNFIHNFEILSDLGYIKLIHQISEKSFIVTFFDSGLLGAHSDIPESMYTEVLIDNPITLSLVYNNVSSELYSFSKDSIYYWTKNMSKVEFVLKSKDKYIGIELKNDDSGKLKSLIEFNNNYDNCRIVRLNNKAPNKKGNVITLPLYLVANIARSFFN